MNKPSSTILSSEEWEITKLRHFSGIDPKDVADEFLVRGCLAGDEEVWVALLQRYGTLIHTIARNFNFPTTIVEEIFQDACLQMIRKMDTLRDPTKLHAWIVTMTKRICLKRQQIVKQALAESNIFEESTTDEVSLEEEIILSEDIQVLQDALSLLDVRCQTLIERLLLTEPKIPYEVVARELGISVGSVGPIRNRCLEKLRQIVVELQNK